MALYPEILGDVSLPSNVSANHAMSSSKALPCEEQQAAASADSPAPRPCCGSRGKAATAVGQRFGAKVKWFLRTRSYLYSIRNHPTK